MFKYLMIVLVSGCAALLTWQSVRYNKQLVAVQKELIKTNRELASYKDDNHRLILEISNQIVESNNQKFGELNEKIKIVDALYSSNVRDLGRLHSTTRVIETNGDSFTCAAKDNYIATINQLFRESTEFNIEVARAADEAIESALIYHSMLEEQSRIVNEVNAQDENNK